MKSADVAAMLEEYNKGGAFRDFVNNCIETYGTDLLVEVHKAITWEYYKYLKGLDRKG